MHFRSFSNYRSVSIPPAGAVQYNFHASFPFGKHDSNGNDDSSFPDRAGATGFLAEGEVPDPPGATFRRKWNFSKTL